MAIISLRQLLDHAAEHGYGVPAYNVNNMEQMHAIMEAADETDSPVIVPGVRRCAILCRRPLPAPPDAGRVEQWPHIPVVMHQDHGASPAVCQRSIQLGFSSVMMDGSLGEDMKTPMSYEYNVEVTPVPSPWRMPAACPWKANWAAWVLWRPAWPARKTAPAPKAAGLTRQLLTDPEEAARFVEDTKVDALAIAIGTSHGAYKFTRPPTGDILAIDRIKEIHARIPDTHLVMHGSSSVPQDWLKIINENGGDMGETYGVPVEEIQEGIKHGVRKVNIDTDLRMASTGAIRKHLHEHPSDFDPAQVPQGGDPGHEGNLQGALRGIRHGRQCLQDQADQPGGNVQALCRRRAGSARELALIFHRDRRLDSHCQLPGLYHFR